MREEEVSELCLWVLPRSSTFFLKSPNRAGMGGMGILARQESPRGQEMSEVLERSDRTGTSLGERSARVVVSFILCSVSQGNMRRSPTPPPPEELMRVVL